MKKSKKFIALTLVMTLLISMTNVFGFTASASTEQDEAYSYTIYTNEDGTKEATITKCPGNLSGVVTVPTQFEGAPVTAIADYAFASAQAVEIILPNSVTDIGISAFSSCEKLEHINIPYGVTKIKAGTFGACAKLQEIIFPDTVNKIESYADGQFRGSAFYLCNSLTSINFNQVKEIEDRSFSSCENLENVNFDGVEIIGPNAFNFCYNLTEIDLSNVKEIGDRAFYCNYKLKNAKNINNLISIGEKAFNQCSALENINLPEGLIKIGDRAFLDCKNLKSATIPSTVEVLDDQTFMWCTSLSSVTLAEGLKTLGEGIFSGCEKLIFINIPDSLKYIGSQAFTSCKALTEIDIKDAVLGGDSIFNSCSALETITMGDDITSIPQATFSGCENLTSIHLPQNITEIDEMAFYHCSSLTEIELPSNLRIIKDYTGYNSGGAFEGCTSLSSIVLPNSLEYLGSSAFKGCTALTSVEMKDNLISIGKEAFSGCTALNSIRFSNSLTTINENTFKNCIGIASIVLPESVETVNDYAFDSCTNLITVDTLNPYTMISNLAFNNCPNLVNYHPAYIYLSIKKQLSKTASESQISTVNEKLSDYRISIFNVTKNKSLSTVTVHSNSITFPIEEVSIGDTIRVTIQCKSNSQPVLLENTVFNVVLDSSKSATLNITVLEKGYATASYTTAQGDDTPLHIALYDAGGNMLDKIVPNNGTATSNKYSAGTYKMLFIKTNSNRWCLDNFSTYESMGLIEGQDYYVKTFQIQDNVITQVQADNINTCNADKLNYLNNNETFITYDDSNLTVDGTVEFTVNYAFKERYQNLSNLQLNLSIPSSYSFITNSLVVNGISQVSTSIPTYISLAQPSGTVKFRLRPITRIDIGIGACIYFKNNNLSYFESIPTVVLDGNYITLNTNSVTNDTLICVAGASSSKSTITIYDDDKILGKVTPDGKGQYKASFSLVNPEDGSIHKIKAVSEGISSNIADVQYNISKPTIQQVLCYIPGGVKHDVTKAFTENEIPVLPASTYLFEITVSNSDTLESVQVVGNKNGKTKILEATRIEGTNTWVTNSYFNNYDIFYIPEKLRIDMKLKAPTVEISEEDVDAVLSEYLKDSTINIVESQENYVVANITLKNGNNVYLKCQVGESIPYTDQNGTQHLITETGFQSTMTSLNFTSTPIPVGTRNSTQDESDTYTKTTKNEDGTTTYELFSSTGAGIFFNEIITDDNAWLDAYNALGEAKDTLEISQAMTRFVAKYGTYKNEIKGLSNLTAEQKISAANDMDSFFALYESYSSMYGFYMIVYRTAALRAPFFTTPLSYAESKTLGAFKQCMENIENAMDARMEYWRNLNNPNPPKDSEFRYVIDPSGYIYEAVPENRLADVTVTIYYKKDMDAEEEKWDAVPYGQKNDLITGKDGTYAWDVPEGYWQVRAVKEGYKTACSEWMTVPPIRTDVNLAMINYSAPQINFLNSYAEAMEISFDKYMNLSTITTQTVTVMNGETPVEVIITPVLSNDSESQAYAKKFLIKPVSGTFQENQSLSVHVSSGAKSYAGISCSPDTTMETLIGKKIDSGNSVDFVSMNKNKDKAVKIFISPGEAAAGRKIYIQNTNPQIITAENELIIDGNGYATIHLHSLQYGISVLTWRIENTDITKDIIVNSTPAVLSNNEVFFDSIKNNVEVKPGDSYTLFNIVPDNISIISSNTAVAKAETGKIIGVSNGTAVMTIISSTEIKQVFVQVGIANEIQDEFTLMQINKYQYVSNRFTETDFVGYDTTCPIVLNGKTFLPVRLGGMSTGCTNIEYNEATQGITMTNQFGTQIQLFTDSNIAKKVYLNGVTETFQMSANVVNIGGRTYLPVRELAALAGYGIEYVDDGSGAFVIINNYDASLQECANIVAQYKDRITY